MKEFIMSRQENAVNAVSPALCAANSKWNHVGGAGGSRAILANIGQLAAYINFADITEFNTIGGVSGGSIPTAIYAGLCEDPRYADRKKITPELLRMGIELDFSALVPRHATPLMTVFAFLLRDRFEYTRPKKGVLSSEGLGEFVDNRVSKWPKNYWTMAVMARTQILFTAEGVWQYLRNGQKRLLSDEPAPLGLAVRASCAVPGIIDAAPWRGRHLFDGALSWDGQCPVGTVIKHYGVAAQDILACDVGDETNNVFAPLGRLLWSLLCGGHCVDHAGAKTVIPDGVLMMKPNIWSVRSLQFNLQEEHKWQAVLSGFQETVIELRRAGLLAGDKLYEALAVCADIKKLKAMAE
jgi:predicted acylesterase/phospholipase RssA